MRVSIDATFAQTLGLINSDELMRLIIKVLKISKPPTRKEDRIALLVAAVKGSGLDRLLAQCDQLQRAALAMAAWGNGRFDAARFKKIYGDLPSFGTLYRYDRDYREKGVAPTPLLLLMPDKQQIPRDLIEPLRQRLPKPAQKPLITLAEPPSDADLVCWYTADTAADAIRSVLGVMREGCVVTTTGEPASVTRKKLLPLIPAPTPWLANWRMVALMQACLLQRWGLVVNTMAQATESGRSAQDWDDAALLQALFQAGIVNGMDETESITGIKGWRSNYLIPSDPKRRRVPMLETLTKLPMGTWVSCESVIDHLCDNGLNIPVVTDDDLGFLALSGSSGWDRQSLAQDETKAQRGLSLCVLQLMLMRMAALGAVDVVARPAEGARTDFNEFTYDDPPKRLSVADGVVAVRLTELGAWLLGRGPQPTLAPPPSNSWRVGADLSVVCLGRAAGSPLALVLGQFATVLDERSWRLDRALALAAVDAGYTVDELEQRLVANITGELPEAVRRFLEDVRRRTSAGAVGALARVVTVQETDLALLLAHDRKTKALCSLAGERTLLVPLESWGAFRRAARSLGWLIPDARDRLP